MNILIIDDERDSCDSLARAIERIGYKTSKAYSGKEALRSVKNEQFDLIISDVSMPDINGIDLVKKFKAIGIMSEIILISGKSEIINSINAIDVGIHDFVTKPIDLIKLIDIIDNIKENTSLTDDTEKCFNNILKLLDSESIINLSEIDISCLNICKNKNLEDICVVSEQMKNIYKKLRKLHQYQDIPILLQGETGTGKELVAKYIHFEGPNQNEPFVAINCATLNKEMFEAELFGYVKGAFTGASPEGREGFIKTAEKGTLFLDEISELSPNTQTKLLRVLQEKEYYQLGGNKKHTANTRFIFASNMDLESLVEKKLFRKDLYYRLNMCKVDLPSLEERKDEIIPLAIFFIKKISQKLNKDIKEIESEAIKKLYDHQWSGNIRELKNIITKQILFNEDGVFRAKNTEVSSGESSGEKKSNIDPKKNIKSNDDNILIIPDKPFSLDDHIRSVIDQTLNKFNGNKTKAAKHLGISRMQLYNRYK